MEVQGQADVAARQWRRSARLGILAGTTVYVAGASTSFATVDRHVEHIQEALAP